MSKKMKVLVSVLVAVLVFTVGGTAMAMAQEEEEEEPALQVEANGLLARVAEILDILEEDLTEAFQQARQELMQERWEEAFNQLLDKAVAEGLLIPEEADEIREWWEEKPEALDPALLRRSFGFACPRDGQMPGLKQGIRLEIRQRLANRFMERDMERECITQDGADEITQWGQNRPEALNSLSPRARIFKAIRGRQMIAVTKGWQGSMPRMAD